MMTEKSKTARIKRLVKKFPSFLERIVAGILMIAVVYACIILLIDVVSFGGKDVSVYLQDILTSAFNVVIVIEFMRMLVKHSMSTIVEVLIFALARGLIVERETPAQMLISICAIALLLAARKFLVRPFQIRNDDDKTENVEEGN